MNILLPVVDKDYIDEPMVYPYLAFCYKLKFQHRKWTGYKELEDVGLNAEWLISHNILFGPTETGGYRFVADNIINLVKLFSVKEPEEYLTSDEMWYTETNWEEYLYVDSANNATLIFEGGAIELGEIPDGVDINKWIGNELIADALRWGGSFYSDSIKKLSDFDFDVVLYDNLSTKVQNKFLRYRESAMSNLKFYNWHNSQSKLEKYADEYVIKCIKDGTYDSLSDYLKQWFSERIKKSKARQKYWGDYICS